MLTDCVRRLVDEPAVGEVTVVDDGSTDGTAAAIRDAFPQVTLVHLPEHRGLAYALNRGADGGESELLLFLNNDVLAAEGAIARLAAALRSDPAAMSAGGRLVEPGSTTTQAAYQPRDIPGLAGLIVRIGGVERIWPTNPWTGGYLTCPLGQRSAERTRRQPAGACLMVRRSALQAIGGWDERFWMWYEDVDISRRLRSLGPALYVPAARFEHVGRASTRGWRKHALRARLYHGSMVYAQLHLSRPRQVVFGVAVLVACLPRWLAAKPIDASAARSYGELARGALALCARRQVPAPSFEADRP
jgi:N-acetylglucosaminyl-diphospho-decaprenol L-rhamnosyltransferase